MIIDDIPRAPIERDEIIIFFLVLSILSNTRRSLCIYQLHEIIIARDTKDSGITLNNYTKGLRHR